MIRYPNLVSECNVDTAFVEMIGYMEPNHAPNIHQVSSILEKQKSAVPCIGFIDDDKKKPAYISSFKLFKKGRYISILKHPSKNQFLVVAIPAMDSVIHNLCTDLGIDLSKYGFPKDFKAFLVRTKKIAIKNDKNFKNLLNTIKQRNTEDVEMVKELVSRYY